LTLLRVCADEADVALGNATAMVVVAQTPEVVEGEHFQVGSGESVRQLLADSFEDADSRQLLDTLGKRLLIALGFLLRCRPAASQSA